MVWANFRFPARWDYVKFSRCYLFLQGFRTRPGWTKRFWELFGAQAAYCILKPIERYASPHIANNVWHSFQRTVPHRGRPCVAMRILSSKKDILICISKLLSVYVPLEHGKTLFVMFQNLGCDAVWTEDITRDILRLQSAANGERPVPPELSAINAVFTDVDVALGYYNAYRRHTWKDYGIRLPKIELKDDD